MAEVARVGRCGKIAYRFDPGVRIRCDFDHKRAGLEFFLRFGPAVAIREFTDADGVSWKVWSTVPQSPGVMHTMKSGWLTFESARARRRLVPIPEGWEDASVARLRQYCLKAYPLSQTPVTGGWRIEKPKS